MLLPLFSSKTVDAIFKRKINPLGVRLLENLEGKKSNERKKLKNMER